MTAAAQSSPEDIDTWTRAYAEDQARQAGVSVREWIAQFVAQTTVVAETTSPEPDAEPARESWDVDAAAEAPTAVADAEDAPEWVSRASAAFAVVEAHSAHETQVLETAHDADFVQAIASAPASLPETVAISGAANASGDDEIEQVLEALLAQVDAVRTQMTAKLREDSARRLDAIENALRGMREQIQSAEQAGVQIGDDGAETLVAPSQYFAAAAEARSLEAGRLVERLDSGFERLEASGALQMAGLRADIEHMFAGLAARIDSLEHRDASPSADIYSQRPPPVNEVDIRPAPLVAEAEVELAEPLLEPTDPGTDPAAFDSDLFDDFHEPAAPTLRQLLNVAPVATLASTGPEALDSPSADSVADFEPPTASDHDLVDSDDDWAAAGSTPLAWRDGSSATSEREFGAASRAPSAEPLPLTIRAPDLSGGQGQDATTGAAKTSIFSLFGRSQSRLRKSA